MRGDISTVAWKELSEVRAGSGGRGHRSAAGIVLVTLFVAVVIPFSAGTAEFGGLAVMSIGLLVAAMWVLTSVPDSFAGERDHRTLETLLATRLPAEAILAGKLLASVAVAAALGTVAIMLSVVASDVGTAVHGEEGDALSVPWLHMLLGFALAVLVAFALGNVGILVALRASSAMVAMRELGLGLAGIAIAVSLGVQALPSGASSDLADVAADIGSLSPWVLAVGTAVVFVVLNAALFVVTRARFTRPKLVRPHG
jgi:ABC-type transport system involved in multi-copper enzyme maturation permease subunit